MRYASPIVQNIKKKNTSHVEEASVAFTESKREIKAKEINYFIHDRDPQYKLRAEEYIVHDFFGQRSIRHSICMSSEGHHQLMMIIAVGEARLMPPELVSRVHLGDG